MGLHEPASEPSTRYFGPWFRAGRLGAGEKLHPRGRRLGPLPLLQGSDATDLLQPSAGCHELRRRPRAGRCDAWSRPSSARPRLARSARCWREPDGLRVAKGLLQAKMNRLLHGRFTNPANAIRETSVSGQPLCVPRPCGRRGHQLSRRTDIRIAVVNRKTCGGGNRTAKGAQAQSILMSVLQSCRGIRVIDIVTSILRAPDNTPVPLVNPER